MNLIDKINSKLESFCKDNKIEDERTKLLLQNAMLIGASVGVAELEYMDSESYEFITQLQLIDQQTPTSEGGTPSD